MCVCTRAESLLQRVGAPYNAYYGLDYVCRCILTYVRLYGGYNAQREEGPRQRNVQRRPRRVSRKKTAHLCVSFAG